jgi:hypothetical protein
MPTLIANSLCDISFSAKTALILLIFVFFSILRRFEGQDNLGYFLYNPYAKANINFYESMASKFIKYLLCIF